MAKKNPLISIIIPVYNAEQYLDKCLSSVKNQTLKEIEVFCIDDGSTDNSLVVLKNFAKKDKRFRVIEQQNQGAAVARNRGLELAIGEYIGFVDSDDYVDEDYFERLYEAAKNKKSDISRAYVKVEGFGESSHAKEAILNKKATESLYNVEGKLATERNKTSLKSVIWLSIYNRKMLDSNGVVFHPSLRTGQDVVFNIEASYYSNDVVYVDKETYYHRVVRDGSLMSSYNYTDSGLISRSIVFKDTVKFINSKPDYNRDVYASRVADGLIFLVNRLRHAKKISTIHRVSKTITYHWRYVKNKQDVFRLVPNLDRSFVDALYSRSKMFWFIYFQSRPNSRIKKVTQKIKRIAKAILPHGIVVLYRRYRAKNG